MSKTEIDNKQHSSPQMSSKTIQGTRIDAAHMISGQDPKPRSESIANLAQQTPEIPPDVPRNDDLAQEQLQRQAGQLAEYLRNRQKEIDHREAQLHAAIAQLECDVRSARMWLSEQEAEYNHRRQGLDVREKEVLQCLERLAATEAELKRKAHCSADADGCASKLQIETRQLAQQAAAIKEERRKWEIERQHAEAQLQHQRQHAQDQSEIRKLHEQLTADRRQLHEEVHLERQRLIAQQRQILADLEKKRQSLQRRSEHVDLCQAALVQLRGELQQMHRETLEIRLATEELWVKLSGAAPPAALTQSLGRIRSRLADQYRIVNNELLEKKKELETFRDQLTRQYEKLIEQKQRFEQWVACRQGESEQHSSRLIAREQELLKLQARFEEQSRQWQLERMEYEQEIHRLRQNLSTRSELPAGVR